MATGVEEVDNILRETAELRIAVPPRRALDFGCGVGRLTQALCRHFDHCDGVDVATSMIAAARRIDAYPDRCSYHLNRSPDLRLFSEGSFSFIYSSLVLQHMHPDLACRYIRELIRVLAGDGVLVFQIPTAGHSSASDAQTSSCYPHPLPESALRATIAVSMAASRASAGEQVLITATVENSGTCTWPSSPSCNARYRIQMANRWLTPQGCVYQQDDGRCPLPRDLAPSDRIELTLLATAPGAQILELDMVPEDVCWFQAVGSTPARLWFDVLTPGSVSTPIIHPTHTPPVPRPIMRRPFRYRWPRTTDLLERLRLWGCLRSVRGWFRRDVRAGVSVSMDMCEVPRCTSENLIRDCHAELRAARTEIWDAGIHSTRYWVTK
ncbi:MAG: class I SAM-dependent methyltransferase [Acidobacteria bacterium]|nr:class I SAM-dependent methyltransferase [Acidobacteriota bacterium]